MISDTRDAFVTRERCSYPCCKIPASNICQPTCDQVRQCLPTTFEWLFTLIAPVSRLIELFSVNWYLSNQSISTENSPLFDDWNLNCPASQERAADILVLIAMFTEACAFHCCESRRFVRDAKYKDSASQWTHYQQFNISNARRLRAVDYYGRQSWAYFWDNTPPTSKTSILANISRYMHIIRLHTNHEDNGGRYCLSSRNWPTHLMSKLYTVLSKTCKWCASHRKATRLTSLQVSSKRTKYTSFGCFFLKLLSLFSLLTQKSIATVFARCSKASKFGCLKLHVESAKRT